MEINKYDEDQTSVVDKLNEEIDGLLYDASTSPEPRVIDDDDMLVRQYLEPPVKEIDIEDPFTSVSNEVVLKRGLFFSWMDHFSHNPQLLLEASTSVSNTYSSEEVNVRDIPGAEEVLVDVFETIAAVKNIDPRFRSPFPSRAERTKKRLDEESERPATRLEATKRRLAEEREADNLASPLFSLSLKRARGSEAKNPEEAESEVVKETPKTAPLELSPLYAKVFSRLGVPEGADVPIPDIPYEEEPTEFDLFREDLSFVPEDYEPRYPEAFEAHNFDNVDDYLPLGVISEPPSDEEREDTDSYPPEGYESVLDDNSLIVSTEVPEDCFLDETVTISKEDFKRSPNPLTALEIGHDSSVSRMREVLLENAGRATGRKALGIDTSINSYLDSEISSFLNKALPYLEEEGRDALGLSYRLGTFYALERSVARSGLDGVLTEAEINVLRGFIREGNSPWDLGIRNGVVVIN